MSSISSENANKQQNSPIEFKVSFAPIVMLSFIRCVSLTLMGIGLPNYVIFDLHESTLAAGFILLAYYLPYSFSSVFLTKFSDKIGRKQALTISVMGTICIYFCYIIGFNLTLVYIASGIEGIFTGMFWPNLEGYISDIKDLDSKYNTRIKQFNLGWNTGTIIGFLMGAIGVYLIGNNRIVFFIAASMNIILFISFLLLKMPTKNQIETFKKHLKAIYPNKQDQQDNIEPVAKYGSSITESNVESNINYAKFSIIIIIILTLVHNFIYNSIPILISAKFLDYGIESYLTYVLAFMKTIFSTTFVLVSDKITLRKIGKIGMICGLTECFIMISFGFFINITVYAILSAIMGITGILIYTCGFKLVLEKNALKNTSFYSGLYEGIIGFVFAIAPVIAGWGAKYNYDLMFVIIGIFGLIFCFVYYILFLREKRKYTLSTP